MREFLAVMAIVMSVTAGKIYPSTIDKAGRQRMLSQRMSKEFLFVAAGQDVAQNRQKMQNSIDLFDSTLKALKDETANISTAIEDAIKNVYEVWTPFRSFLEDHSLSVQQTDVKVLLEVAEQNMPVLKLSNALVQIYTKESGLASNKVIDLAGRQRMLIQKMMKEIAFVALGVDTETNLNTLKGTAFEFSDAHTGIIRGLGIADVPPLDNMCTMKQMRLVSHKWQILEPTIMEILNAMSLTVSENTAAASLSDASAHGDALFVDMVAAVKLFVNPTNDCEFLSDLTREELVFLLNTGGKQRMLSQKATFLYMNVAIGADIAKSTTELLLTVEEGEHTLHQLIEGDYLNNITSPPSQAFLDGLLDALRSFADLRNVFDQAIYRQKTSPTYVRNADTHSLNFLEEMSAACALVVEDAVTWAKDKGIHFPARVLDLSGRQRMLMQKMSKEAALISYGANVDANTKRFEGTIALFKSSHRLLLDGANEANMSADFPPTTDHCIVQQMKKVDDHFRELEEVARALAYGQDGADPVQTVLRLTFLNQGAFDAMNRAVGFYVDGKGTCDPPANSEVGISLPEEWEGYASLSIEEWEGYIMKLGRLRELTQIVAKNHLLVETGVNRTKYQNALDESIIEIESSIRIVKYGADKIPAPPTQVDFDQFVAIEREWSIFADALEASKAAGGTSLGEGQLLTEVDKAIARVVSAAGAVQTKAPVSRLNIVSRQLALVEQMAKEAVLRAWGEWFAESRRLSISGETALVSTIRLYEQSHQELLGMIHDQREDVLAQMERVQDAWVMYKDALQVIAEGSRSANDVRAMDERLTALRAELDSTLRVYSMVVPWVPLPPVQLWVKIVRILVPASLILCPMLFGAVKEVGSSKTSSMSP